MEDDAGGGFVRGMVSTSADGVSWQRVPGNQPGWNVAGETRIMIGVAPLGSGLAGVGTSYSSAGDLDAHRWTFPDALPGCF